MFLSVVFMWFWSWFSRLGQILSMSIGVLRHQARHIAQQFGNLFSEQQRWLMPQTKSQAVSTRRSGSVLQGQSALYAFEVTTMALR